MKKLVLPIISTILALCLLGGTIFLGIYFKDIYFVYGACCALSVFAIGTFTFLSVKEAIPAVKEAIAIKKAKQVGTQVK